MDSPKGDPKRGTLKGGDPKGEPHIDTPKGDPKGGPHMDTPRSQRGTQDPKWTPRKGTPKGDPT